jgi:hypothetical protein
VIFYFLFLFFRNFFGGASQGSAGCFKKPTQIPNAGHPICFDLFPFIFRWSCQLIFNWARPPGPWPSDRHGPAPSDIEIQQKVSWHEEIELNFDASCQQVLGLESEILWEARSTPTLDPQIVACRPFKNWPKSFQFFGSFVFVKTRTVPERSKPRAVFDL